MIIWEEVVGQVRWTLERKLTTTELELFHSTNYVIILQNNYTLASIKSQQFALFLVDIVQRTYFAAVDMRHLLFFIDLSLPLLLFLLLILTTAGPAALLELFVM